MNSPEGISIIEARFRMVLTGGAPLLSAASSGVQALLGYGEADFLSGKVTVPNLIHDDDQDIAAILFSTDLREKDGDFNIRVRQADGRIRCVKGRYHKEAGAHGVALDLLFQDAKSLPRTMSEASAMSDFTAMMENTDDYIYFKDRNHVFTGASQTLVALCHPAEHWTDLIGQTDYDVFPEEYADLYYGLEKQVFLGIPAARDVQKTLSKDGQAGWVDNRKYPIRDADGQIIGLFGVARDITALKQAEIALTERDARLVEAAALANLGSWETDLSTLGVKWSEELYRTFDLDPAAFEPTHQSFLSFVHPEDRAKVDAAFVASLGGRSRHEIEHRIVTGGGCVKFVVERWRVVHDDQGRPVRVAGTCQDISDRKLAEEALRESELRWKFATEGAGDGLWDWNVATSKVFFTRRWKEMLGFAEDEIGDGLDEWSKRIHPDDLAQTMAAVQAHLDGMTPVYANEHRVSCRDGSWKWILDRGLVVSRSGDGKPVRMVGTHSDISARKTLEQSVRASLLEKEALLKETHHRVKNNLALIVSLMRLTAGQAEEPETRTVLTEMQTRMQSVILLTEMLYKSASYTRVQLAEYVKELATNIFQAQTARSGAVRLVLDLGPVEAPTDQAIPCGLIVNELMTNSLKHAFPGGGGGEVTVSLLPLAKGQVRLSVRDTGVGLPADFETRRGQSLGLQLVSVLAHQLGGTLEVSPGPGAGFTVIFPVVDDRRYS